MAAAATNGPAAVMSTPATSGASSRAVRSMARMVALVDCRGEGEGGRVRGRRVARGKRRAGRSARG